MASYRDLADVVDETIEALAGLNLDRLQDIEERAQALGEVQVAGEIWVDQILAKKRVLELVLKNGEEVLETLQRLNGRSAGSQWAL